MMKKNIFLRYSDSLSYTKNITKADSIYLTT